METEHSLLCPICTKDDSIRKVSSIVIGDTSSSSYSGPSVGITHVDGKWATTGGYTTLRGESSTTIAQLLFPPNEPSKRGGFGFLGWGSMILIIGVVAFTASIWGFHLLEMGRDTGAIILTLIGILIFLGAYFACVYFFIYLSKEDKKTKARNEIRYQREYSAWEKATTRWLRLYYCYRDDVVFDPLNDETCHPVNLDKFIFSNQSHKTIKER